MTSIATVTDVPLNPQAHRRALLRAQPRRVLASAFLVASLAAAPACAFEDEPAEDLASQQQAGLVAGLQAAAAGATILAQALNIFGGDDDPAPSVIAEESIQEIAAQVGETVTGLLQELQDAEAHGRIDIATIHWNAAAIYWQDPATYSPPDFNVLAGKAEDLIVVSKTLTAFDNPQIPTYLSSAPSYQLVSALKLGLFEQAVTLAEAAGSSSSYIPSWKSTVRQQADFDAQRLSEFEPAFDSFAEALFTPVAIQSGWNHVGVFWGPYGVYYWTDADWAPVWLYLTTLRSQQVEMWKRVNRTAYLSPFFHHNVTEVCARRKAYTSDPNGRCGLKAGDHLASGQYLQSADKSHIAVQQASGDFVVYQGSDPANIQAYVWSTGFLHSGSSFATMQADGNFVVAKGTGPNDNQGTIWHTGTDGSAADLLYLGNDGGLYLLDANEKVLWCSTYCPEDRHPVVTSESLVWQHDNGQVVSWTMRGGQPIGSANVGTPVPGDWTLHGLGDVDGNGIDDIIWRHANGQVAYWSMVGGQPGVFVDVGAPVGADWTLVGIGNVDGEINGVRTDDIIWRHSSGQVHYWSMANGQPAGGFNIHIPIGNEFAISGVGDMNNDGTDDILWRYVANGHLSYWIMNSGQMMGFQDIGPAAVDGALSTRDIGDVSGDGIDDIIWRHNDGRALYWGLANPATGTPHVDISAPVGHDWTLVGVGRIH